MAALKPKVPQTVRNLIELLDEALILLRESSYISETLDKTTTPPASLLDQCISLCASQAVVKQESIRTVHHFACTGGTLISKCLAAMPNTNLISEVDPLNIPVKAPPNPQFVPTDMVRLLQQSTRGAQQSVIIELFVSNLEIVYLDATQKGQRLILRDHAHSHFCRGERVADRPSLRDIVAARFPVASVVTVRHPVDSYLSLKANGWMHFSPPTFDEYCGRYLSFLAAYQDVQTIRYEDFVSDPQGTMQSICEILGLIYEAQFIDLFQVFKLTGDSGRGSSIIEAMPRRAMEAEFAEEISNSANFMKLQRLLGYYFI